MLRLSREALPMRRGSYRVQRLSVKRNTSQTDQAGKYFLLTFERAFFWLGRAFMVVVVAAAVVAR